MFLNEFMPMPGAGLEYIELYNSGLLPVDLTGWKLAHTSKGGTMVYVFAFKTVIQPKEFLTFYENSTGIQLSDASDDVQLLYPNDVVADERDYKETLMDQAYSRSVDGGGVWVRDCEHSPNAGNCMAPWLNLGFFGIGVGLLLLALATGFIGIGLAPALLIGAIGAAIAGWLAIAFHMGGPLLLVLGALGDLLAAIIVLRVKKK